MRSLPLAPCYPSASAVRRASVCVAPWSLGLPREDTTSPDAERGRLLHAGAEALARRDNLEWCNDLLRGRLNDGTFPFGSAEREAFAFTMAHVEETLAADREAAIGPGKLGLWLVEQGVEWRSGFPDEARLVDRGPGDEVPGWYSGTADLVYVRADGVLVVADWKFGPRSRYTAERAEEHWQGWTLALGFATALGISAARPSDVVARFEARYVDEHGAWVDGYDITGAELEAHAGTLTELEARIRASEGPRVGPACGDCKAKAACPAWGALVETAIERVGVALPPSLLWDVPATPEEAAMAWQALKALEGAVPVVRRNIEAVVRAGGPVDLGMGLELHAKATDGKERALDTPEALAVAAQILGVEPGAFTRPTTSKGAMVKAWARKTGKKTSGADAKAMAKHLREAGVLVVGAPGVKLDVRRRDGAKDDSEDEEEVDHG